MPHRSGWRCAAGSAGGLLSGLAAVVAAACGRPLPRHSKHILWGGGAMVLATSASTPQKGRGADKSWNISFATAPPLDPIFHILLRVADATRQKTWKGEGA